MFFKRAAAPVQTPGVVCFPVDDVQAKKRAMRTEPLATSLTGRYMRQVLVLPDSDTPVVNAMDAGIRCHPLLGAIHGAFSQHYPLTLSPDAIWLVIAQGFSHHVTENAEALRHRLVRHQGRRELTATVGSLNVAGFAEAIASFSQQIRDASDPVLHETLLCDFTTTTPGIRTASQVAIMDTYSSYFEYLMRCICGIPRINLTGTLEDWERIRARLEVLETFDLRWWVTRLRPIIDEFVEAIKGNRNREFWQAIYKPRESYGNTSVTGWFADLFPYLGEAPKRVRNHVFQYERENWSIPVEKGVETWHPMFDPTAAMGVSFASFPSGLSSVPIKLSGPGAPIRELDLVAGYFAVEQDRRDYSLSPVIGWSVAEQAPSKPILI